MTLFDMDPGATMGRETAADGGAEERVALKELLEFLRGDISRRMHLRELLWYVLLLVLLTAELVLTEMPSSAHSVGSHMLSEHVRDVLSPGLEEAAAALPGDSEAALWWWMGNVSKSARAHALVGLVNLSVCSTTAGHDPQAVGVILFRQWRTQRGGCALSAVREALPPAVRGALPCGCPDSRGGVWSSAPYGPGDPPQWQKRAVPAGTVRTFRHTYDDGAAFAEPMQLRLDSTQVSAHINSMRGGGWVDDATRLVSADAVFVHTGTARFARCSCWAELSPFGNIDSGCSVLPFEMLSFSELRFAAAFALEVGVLVLSFVALFFFQRCVRFALRVQPHAIPLSPSDAFEFGRVLTVICAMGFRFRLWAESAAMKSDGFYSGGDEGEDNLRAFSGLSEYARHAHSCRTTVAVAALMSYLGLLRYTRYISREFNVLSETAEQAFPSLLRLVVVFAVVLAAYALAGTLLYSKDLSHFEGFSRSAGWLARVLVLGGEGEWDWNQLRDPETPLLSPFYFGSFWLISYFLLLNIIMAVIVASFARVQDAQNAGNAQREEKYLAKLDQRIATLREQGTQHAAAPAQGLCARIRAHPLLLRTRRLCHSVWRHLVRAHEFVRGKTGNRRRERAIAEIKNFAAQEHLKSGANLPILEQRPDYYARLYVSPDQLSTLLGEWLNDEDLKSVYEGTVERTAKAENAAGRADQRVARLAAYVARLLALAESGALSARHAAELNSARERAAELEQESARQRRLAALWRPAALSALGMDIEARRAAGAEVGGEISVAEEEALLCRARTVHAAQRRDIEDECERLRVEVAQLRDRATASAAVRFAVPAALRATLALRVQALEKAYGVRLVLGSDGGVLAIVGGAADAVSSLCAALNDELGLSPMLDEGNEAAAVSAVAGARAHYNERRLRHRRSRVAEHPLLTSPRARTAHALRLRAHSVPGAPAGSVSPGSDRSAGSARAVASPHAAVEHAWRSRRHAAAAAEPGAGDGDSAPCGPRRT